MFLRKQWRIEPRAEVIEIAAELLAIIERQKPDAPVGAAEHCKWVEGRLNMLSWTRGISALGDVLEGFVVHLTFGQDTTRLEALLLEMLSGVNQGEGRDDWFLGWLRRPRVLRQELDEDVLDYFERSTGEMEPTSSGAAALAFWKGWILFEEHHVDFGEMESKERLEGLRRACRHFERAADVFDVIPRAREFARRYLRTAVWVGVYDPTERSAQERAYAWAQRYSTVKEGLWKECAGLLHNLGMYREAAARCREACEGTAVDAWDKACAYDWQYHCYQHHLGESALAEDVARRAIGEDLGEEFQERLAEALEGQQKYEEAVEALRRRLGTARGADARAVRLRLARVLRWDLGQQREAVALYEQVRREEEWNVEAAMGMASVANDCSERAALISRALERCGHDAAGSLNQLAWVYYLRGVQLDDAATVAHRAYGLAEDEELRAHAVHTWAAILVRGGEWEDARRAIGKWLDFMTPERARDHWSQDVALFRDAVRRGFGKALAALVEGKTPERLWVPLAWALRSADSGQDPAGLRKEFRDLAIEFRQQLCSAEEGLELPVVFGSEVP